MGANIRLLNRFCCKATDAMLYCYTYNDVLINILLHFKSKI